MESVMLWAALSWYSIGPVITLTGKVTADVYKGILGEHVHSMVQTLFPSGSAVFQDDTAPVHTATCVKEWFEEHEGEVKHLPWPAQSPDLNIIEPL